MQTNHSNHQGPNPQKIHAMFSKVAQNYDRANTVLSGGVHHLWRKFVVSYANASAGQTVLDCATGTGDLAIEFKKAVGPTGVVIGTDFCEEMMIPAPKKAKDKGLDIHFEKADVTDLQFENNRFDITSISFGIRNVANPLQGITEMARVTKPGGAVIVLEFGQIQWPVIGSLYNFYSEKILPKLGGLVTGEPEAYEYLQKSSAAFPCGEEFANLMKSSEKFSRVEYKALTGGIAFVYKGIVGN